MSGKNKHTINSLSDFLNYLRGKLSGRERNAFEKELQKDPFAEEAIEGLESIEPGEVEEDLLNLNSHLSKRVEKSNRVLYFRIAATVAVILTVSTLYFTLSDRQMEEFKGARQVTEAVKEEKTEAEKFTEPAGKNKNGIDTVKEEKLIANGPDQERKIERDITEEKALEEEKRELKSETEEKTAVIAKEEPRSKKSEITAQPEIKEPELTAAKVQEESITVPQRQDVASAPKQAISEKRSFAQRAISDAPASNVIRGTVLSAEDNMPIQGVSVRVRGTNTGAVTDSEGNFSIKGVGEQNPKLVASFIGMENEEVDARKDQNIKILMEPSELALNEVVIISSGREAVDQVSRKVTEINDLDNEIENTYQAAYPAEGKGNFKDNIEENMIYPDSSIDRAVVVLKFIVTKSGRPAQIEVLRSPSEKFSEEAIRLLKEGPDWVPAENENQYIEDATRIRIMFKKEP